MMVYSLCLRPIFSMKPFLFSLFDFFYLKPFPPFITQMKKNCDSFVHHYVTLSIELTIIEIYVFGGSNLQTRNRGFIGLIFFVCDADDNHVLGQDSCRV